MDVHASSGDTLSGGFLVVKGFQENGFEIGPFIAEDETVARRLFYSFLELVKNNPRGEDVPVAITVPEENKAAVSMVEEMGFRLQFKNILMGQKKGSVIGDFKKTWAICAMEKG